MSPGNAQLLPLRAALLHDLDPGLLLRFTVANGTAAKVCKAGL